jgi:hypothetical protein
MDELHKVMASRFGPTMCGETLTLSGLSLMKATH